MRPKVIQAWLDTPCSHSEISRVKLDRNCSLRMIVMGRRNVLFCLEENVHPTQCRNRVLNSKATGCIIRRGWHSPDQVGSQAANLFPTAIEPQDKQGKTDGKHSSAEMCGLVPERISPPLPITVTGGTVTQHAFRLFLLLGLRCSLNPGSLSKLLAKGQNKEWTAGIFYS